MLPKGMLKEHVRAISLILRSIDIAAILMAGCAAYGFKFGNYQLSLPYILALLTGAVVTAIVFQSFQIYVSIRAKGTSRHLSQLAKAIATTLFILAGLAFLTKTGEYFSRSWFITWAATSFILLLLFRLALLFVLRIMRSRGWNERRVIIIGASDLGTKLAGTVQQALWTGFRIVAIFDDNAEFIQRSIGSIAVQPTPKNISTFLADTPETIDEVWLALPLWAEARVKAIMHDLRFDTVTTRFVLDIFGLDLLNHSISDLAGFPVLNIRSTPMVGVNRLVKAVEDRVLSLGILILISPLFLIIALAVKLSSKGPIFFKQKRISWNGKEFNMLKFRSMPIEAEAKTGPVWATAGENRATWIGRFLRKTSLDELPQFINVLCGDMSIVGPRPERLVFVEQFKEKIPRYMQKHLVKAGITGWAQINGWRGNTSLEKRIEYDLHYIQNWSLWLDLKIIFLTFFKGFFHKNAY